MKMPELFCLLERNFQFAVDLGFLQKAFGFLCILEVDEGGSRQCVCSEFCERALIFNTWEGLWRICPDKVIDKVIDKVYRKARKDRKATFDVALQIGNDLAQCRYFLGLPVRSCTVRR